MMCSGGEMEEEGADSGFESDPMALTMQCRLRIYLFCNVSDENENGEEVRS